MKLDKTKLQEVVEKIAYQQTAEDQADDLFNKMGILNEYVQEQLALRNVLELTETEARHIRRLIAKELTVYKSQQSVVSEIRLRELDKKLQPSKSNDKHRVK